MNKQDLLKTKVSDMNLENINFKSLIQQYEAAGGFSAKNLAVGANILKEAQSQDCIKFFSFPACIVATGLRGAIAQMIDKGMIDVIITTCGTLDHDIARSIESYYHGSFELDDEKLKELNINRLGNILVPNESYGIPLEKFMNPILEELVKIKSEWGPRELIHEFGKRMSDKNSILYQAYKKNIPIYVPGITDGAFGTNLTWFSQDHNFKLDILKDERELADTAFTEKKTSALMIGGGISKHHTIWWAQFKGGLDYAVYITTATQYDGSLSGARLTEAVSWGKINPKAKFTTIDGDATIILPIILAAIYEK